MYSVPNICNFILKDTFFHISTASSTLYFSSEYLFNFLSNLYITTGKCFKEKNSNSYSKLLPLPPGSYHHPPGRGKLLITPSDSIFMKYISSSRKFVRNYVTPGPVKYHLVVFFCLLWNIKNSLLLFIRTRLNNKRRLWPANSAQL